MKRRRFKTLYLDPPWPERGGGKIRRGANRHYETMSVKEIIAMPVGELAEDNAHLYLWVTNNYLEAGLAAMRAWGFRYVTMITWPKPKMGIGQYFRGKTEHCLFGVRGNLPYKVAFDKATKKMKRQQGTTLLSVWSSKKHSEKPPEMREIIERVSYEPRVELFARARFKGWSAWGNQVKSDIKFLEAV